MRLHGPCGPVFNPEEHFEQSEYYSFIQALFKDDQTSLRDDIVVLTYNYDPSVMQGWRIHIAL
jgi:hypothetical protein